MPKQDKVNTSSSLQYSLTPLWSPAVSWFLAILVLWTLAVYYATPVKDGDLWWQMAYGRYLIDNRTLIPDHTIFSWTPAEGGKIYCCWISEIFLYLIYQIGGLSILFAFRYFCLFVFVFLLLLHARQHNVLAHPLTWLVCLLGLLMSSSAAFIKPEIFSYVLHSLTVWTWWKIKSSRDKAWRYCYLFPVLMFFWVNSHGGYIFGLTFLGLIGLGELMNVLLSPGKALNPETRKHLFIALILSGLALFLTPYGLELPLRRLQGLSGGRTVEEYRAITAYLSIFYKATLKNHSLFIEYLIIAGIILFGLILPKFRKRSIDWTIILTNLVFGWLYITFLRATYFLAPVFSFSSLHLLSHRPAWLWPQHKKLIRVVELSMLIICILMVGMATYVSFNPASKKWWFGFGISYQNPVEEAEFIRKHLSGLRLGNGYGEGGYLLWALWPETKVFIDPRDFPFRSWFNEYSAFIKGRNWNSFMKKYQCDVWCIRYRYEKTIQKLLTSSDWKPIFYGSAAAVFVRKDLKLPDYLKKVGSGVADIKNFKQALLVLKFAMNIKDLETAKIIIEGMKNRFILSSQKKKIQSLQHTLYKAGAKEHYNLGLAHWKKGRLDEAISEYEKALTINPDYVKAHVNLGVAYQNKGRLNEAITEYKKAISIDPNFLKAHVNLGIAYQNKGRLNEAITEYKKAISIDPNFSKAHSKLAFAYYYKGNYKSAIFHCDKVVKLKGGVNPKLLELLKPYR